LFLIKKNETYYYFFKYNKMDIYYEMSNLLFDIKDKISDIEYLNMFNLLKKIKDNNTNINNNKIYCNGMLLNDYNAYINNL